MSSAAELQARAAGAADAAAQAVAWIGDNAERLGEEGAGLAREFRRHAVAASKLGAAVHRPMCVGVFGPSQSGKSYLISALARRLAEPLIAEFGAEGIDFIRDINPVGGRESTGLVTRFTIHPSPQAPPEGFPVQIRLLSQPDIIKIIANTYYLDCDHTQWDPVGPAEIQRRIDELRPRAGTGDGSPGARNAMQADDMYDLQTYFDRSFEASSGAETIRRLRDTFWPQVEELAPRLGLQERARLFSLLWGEVPRFTDLYLRLSSALEQLGYADEAFCRTESLVPRESSIIDVATLAGLGEDSPDLLEVVTRAGSSTKLPRSVVTALTAELKIVMRDKPWDFFEHTDLLDFPGARSRIQIKRLSDYLQDAEALHGLFLRGKVAYLFERYSADRELTSMLLGIADGNQEVRSLPIMVNDWIESTHGSTPAERGARHNALFLVLTKFDRELETKRGEGGPEERWQTRLHSSLLDFFGNQHLWPQQWDPQGPFRNTFWMRNPDIESRDVFDYDAQGRETGVREGERARLAELKRGFLSCAAVKDHFESPAEAWDAAFELNDGGVAYLAKRLAPVCNPQLKLDQIDGRLGALCADMSGRLEPFYVSDDLEAERAKKRELATILARWISKVASQQRLGELLCDLQMNEEELRRVFLRSDHAPVAGQNGAEEGEPDAPRSATGIGATIDPTDLLRQAGLGGESDPDARLETPRIAAESELFARAVMRQWIDRMHEIGQSERLKAYYLSADAEFALLAQELSAAARRLDLVDEITTAVDEPMRYRGNTADLPVRLALNVLNRFVSGMGFDRLPLEQRPRAGQPGNPRAIFSPRPEVGDYPQLDEKPSAYEQTYVVDWMVGLVRLVEDNARDPASAGVDLEQNSRLARILSSLGHGAA